MLVNSVQFPRTVGLFNNQKVLKCNMNQLFFSDITMRQCHITLFCIFSSLVLLHLVLFLRFIFLPQQLRIQILVFAIYKLAFAIRLLFICIFYGSIYFWFYNRTVDLSRNIEKNLGPRPSSSQKLFDLSLEPKEQDDTFLCKIFPLLKATILSVYKFKVCLSETYLGSSVLSMMPIWKYSVMNQSDQTTHRNIKGLVYVFISEILFHRK